MSSNAIAPIVPQLLSHNTTQKPPTSFPFTFSAASGTDLWLKPAPINGPPISKPLIATNQPTFYTALPIESFIRASATISFVPEILYDQVGLAFLFPSDPSKWVKGGLEYVDGEAKLSVVAARGNSKGADWSVSPPSGAVEAAGRVHATVVFEREEEGTGTSLLIKIDGKLLREVTWVFAAPGDPHEEIWVGFYGARPDVTGELAVSVENWDLDVKKS